MPHDVFFAIPGWGPGWQFASLSEFQGIVTIVSAFDLGRHEKLDGSGEQVDLIMENFCIW